MTYAELARLKGKSLRTVKSWPKRGLKVIRRSHCDVEITPDAVAALIRRTLHGEFAYQEAA